MTEFNSQHKKDLTNNETLGPAMNITDSKDAKQYFDSYVEYLLPYILKDNKELSNVEIVKKTIEIAKNNIGYYSGYYNEETRKRISIIFSCHNPYFGNTNYNNMSANDIYRIGYNSAIKFVRKLKLDKINHL